MNLLLLLRIMNRFALVFAMLNLIFALAGYQGGTAWAYLGLSVVTWLAAGFRRALRPVLLILPVPILAWAGAWPVHQTVHLGLAVAYAVYLALQGIEPSYDAAIDDFNAGVVTSLALLGLAMVSFKPAAFERSTAPFILIYLVSSVVTLRTARDTAAGGRVAAAGHLLSVGVVTAAAVLCSPTVRWGILGGLKAGYTFLLQAVKYLLGWLILAIGAVVAELIQILTAIGRRKGIKMPPAEQSPLLEQILKMKGRGAVRQFLDSRYLSLFVQALLIILAGLVLVRVFRRRHGEAAAGQTGFTEVRDGIPRSRQGWTARLAAIRRRPADPGRAVRFYYGLFLRLCLKKDVEIRPSDTSAEIDRKARDVFERDALEKLRQIYLAVRYGGLAAGNEAAQMAGRCYRSLKAKG